MPTSFEIKVWAAIDQIPKGKGNRVKARFSVPSVRPTKLISSIHTFLLLVATQNKVFFKPKN